MPPFSPDTTVRRMLVRRVEAAASRPPARSRDFAFVINS
jgi:hypothetical protein